MKWFFSIVVILFIINGYSQEVCNNSIDDDDDGLIDCYDPDCYRTSTFCNSFYLGKLDSSLITSCSDHFELIELWRVNPINTIGYQYESPMVGDIDQDGVPEIVLRNKDYFEVRDGMTGNLKGTTTINNYWGQCVGDVDYDGFGEIFVSDLGTSQIVRYEHTLGSPTWTSPAPSSYSNDYLSLADFDQDGVPEVYTGGNIFNAQNGSLLVNQSSKISLFPTRVESAIAVDILPDIFCIDCQGLEIVNGAKVFSVNIATGSLTLAAYAPNSLPTGPASIADFDNDGLLDIAVNGGDTIYIYDPRKAKQIGNLFTFDYPNAIHHNVEVLTVGNIDNDPMPEIAMIDDQFYMLDHDLSVIWVNDFVRDNSSGYVSSVMFDFNCDGLLEIVVRGDDSALHILRGHDGVIMASSNLCTSGTAGERPIIADINNDGHADIVCGCKEGLVAWTGAAPNNWAAARSVFNQFSYFNVNVNDDLTIPSHQQYHANKLLPAPLNSFMIQAPLYDIEGMSCKKTNSSNDMSINIDSILSSDCDSVQIFYTICNVGDDSISLMPLYYSIYKDFNTSRSVFFKDSILDNLLPGQCMAKSIKSFTDGSLLYFYVNDKGEDLFYHPDFTFTECNFDNNYDSIDLSGSDNLSSLIGQDRSICSGDTVILSLNESGANILWSTGQNSNSVVVSDTGTYWVEILSSNGCFKKDTVIISYMECDTLQTGAGIFNLIFIPNIFNPNGDGVNNEFNIVVNNGAVSKMSLYIFDRFGREIFQDSGKTNVSWNGKNFQGKQINTGVYVYMLNVEVIDGTSGFLQGNVTLLK